MSTYVNDLRLEEIGTGERSGTWGTATNVSLELIGEALGFGTEAITTNADTHTTTVADGATDPGRAIFLKYTGTLDSACTITIGPNTISRLHFIENGTSGSQNIIISQGSGANVTIPPGDVKVVYLDGAGSGAAVVDAFASLSVVDLKVQDDLTVTDDATIGGTLGVTGVLTATSLDISGDIDVDGTTNLDAVDIDGAVQVDGTITVGVDDTGYDVKFFGDTASAFMLWDASVDDLILGGAAQLGIGNGSTAPTATLDVRRADVSGKIAEFHQSAGFGLEFGSSQAQAYIEAGSSQTLLITVPSDLNIDSGGDIILDADGADILLKDAGTTFGELTNSSTDFVIKSSVSDKDMLFKGNDGGSAITALTLDMSAAGAATFNDKITAVGTSVFTNLDISGDVDVDGTTNLDVVDIDGAVDMASTLSVGGTTTMTNSSNATQLILQSTDADSSSGPVLELFRNSSSPADNDAAGLVYFYGENDASEKIPYGQIFTQIKDMTDGTEDGSIEFYTMMGGTSTSKLLLNATETVFNEGSVDVDFRVESNGLANMLFVDAGNDKVGLGTNSPASVLHIFDGSANTANTITFGNPSSTPKGEIHYTAGGNEFLTISAKGTNSGLGNIVFETGATPDERVRIANDGVVGIGTASGTQPSYFNSFLNVQNNGATSSNASVTITAGSAAFAGLHFGDSDNGRIGQIAYNNSDNSLLFTANNSERMRIANDGTVMIGRTDPLSGAEEQGTVIFNTGFLMSAIDGTGTTSHMAFIRNAAVNSVIVGSITSNGSATAFNTSSDYRLKENVTYSWDATTRLKQLKPARFNFISDSTDTLVDGFLAHEVSSVVPEAITGDKDGTYTEQDESDNLGKEGDAKYQAIDQSKLVPLLVKTIQELEARITALES